MRIHHADPSAAKGWFEGPWNTGLGISIGYANVGVDEPHRHRTVTEIYLAARGWSLLRVEGAEIRLEAGDAALIEPGEAHTFTASSADYFHFVIHLPGLAGEAAKADKVPALSR
jgi:quercetin dioxygenase-like cupin family protein